MGVTLYDYQFEDVEKLSRVPSRLIGSDMGTGKSYEAIFLDLEGRKVTPNPGPTLVVTKLSMLYDWELYWNTAAPQLSVKLINNKKRNEFEEDLSNGNHDIYITHWESLRLMPTLGKVKFFHVIGDEIHSIANRKAQVTRALKVIRTLFKTAISGTYYGDKPWNAWSVLNWLYPTYYRSYWKFDSAFVDTELVITENRQYRKIKGPKNVQYLLDEMRPFYVRHLKRGQCCPHHPNGVQSQLPGKYPHPMFVDLEPKQRKAYEQMKKDLVAWLGTYPDDQALVAPVAIAKLARLQQLAISYANVEVTPEGLQIVEMTEPSPKLDAVMDIVEGTDEQLVVFTNYKDVVKLLAARLDKASITYSTLTGDTPQAKRDVAIRDFQQGRSRIFVGTIGAGGIGINLSMASTVIFIDRHPAAYRNEQAEDRLDRIGQKNAVQVIDILANHTVDFAKMQMLKTKKEWLKMMLGDC